MMGFVYVLGGDGQSENLIRATTTAIGQAFLKKLHKIN